MSSIVIVIWKGGESIMSLLLWVLFGLVVGAVAHWIYPSNTMGGLLGSLILGIIGALVGGFIGNLIFGVGITGFNLSSLIVAIIGSIIVLWLVKAFQRA